MFSALQRQQKLMSAKPSLLSVSNAFLDPLLIVFTLLGVAIQAGESFDRNYVILALIVFSLSFPARRGTKNHCVARHWISQLVGRESPPSCSALPMPANIWRCSPGT